MDESCFGELQPPGGCTPPPTNTLTGTGPPNPSLPNTGYSVDPLLFLALFLCVVGVFLVGLVRR